MTPGAACPACEGPTAKLRLPLDRAVLHRCVRCGHAVTAAGPPHLDETAYAGEAAARPAFERAYLPARLRSYARGLALLGSQTGRLLDYGCNYGHFLMVARDGGWEAHGYEPGEALRRAAVPTVAARIHATLEDAAVAGPYDLVTLWDVLEHLPDVPERLADVASLLRRGGRVLVRVPDARALGPAVLGRIGPLDHAYLKLCHPVNPEEHFTHFTPESLLRLATMAGFSVERLVDAGADERVAAGRTPVDGAVRRMLHHRRRALPYEFTAVLRLGEDGGR